MTEYVSPPGALRPLPKTRFLTDWARRLTLGRLTKLQTGRLEVVEGSRERTFGEPHGTPQARLEVKDPRFFLSLALGGSLGAAESYVRGEWSCGDLTQLVRLMALNQSALEGIESGTARLATPFLTLFHWLRRNTLRGSRRNIAAHYDLGNDFYALFLDPTMTYSCGVFETPEASLQDASVAKYERICRKLALSPRHHLLEIGCGWGGFAIHAASRFGCRVTAATISDNQFYWARRRVDEAGLADRVHVVLQDYRELEGRFDRLASIEMIEAVGHHYYDLFFNRCGALLKPDGLMLLQAITIPDARYERARDSVDFIKRHIFPGSCLPSIAALTQSAARAGDLTLRHLEDITPHYARTLRAWRQRFLSHRAEIAQLGFGEEFIRLWEFYFCYCEGGFAERTIGDVQMLFAKPLDRSLPILPSLERQS